MRRVLLLSSTPAALPPADGQIPPGSAARSVQVQGPRRSEEMGTGARGWPTPEQERTASDPRPPRAAALIPRWVCPASPPSAAYSQGVRQSGRPRPRRPLPPPDLLRGPEGAMGGGEQLGARGLGPRRGRRSSGAAEGCAPRSRAELLRCGRRRGERGEPGRKGDRLTGRDRQEGERGARAGHEGSGAAAPDRSPGRSARGGRTAPPGKDIAAGARPPR